MHHRGDLIHRHHPGPVQPPHLSDLFLVELGGPSALPSSCPGGFESGAGAFADQVAFELRQRPEDVEHERTARCARVYRFGQGTELHWIGNGVLDSSLEDESLLREFVGAPVSEGGTEPLVVGPPRAVVGVMTQLPDRGIVVPVHEILPQQPVHRFDHGVVVGTALARQRSFDVEHVEQLVNPRVVEPAAPVGVEHLDVRQREVEGGEHGQHQARVPGPPGGMAGDAPIRQTGQQAHVRPASADADIGKIASRTRVRGVTVELAVRQVREPGLVGPRPVRFGPLARVRTRHAPPAHDAADAPSGRGDALPFQGGLDLPDAVASAAVAPDRAHVAGDRIHMLRPGMPGHPVVGGAGNAQYPALRRYRAAGGVGPYHACLRANTGAACSETSTSISNCLLRLPGPTGSFCSGVRLSVARVEPLLRMPWTQRRGVDRAMAYSALISREGLLLSHDCTICRLNASS